VAPTTTTTKKIARGHDVSDWKTQGRGLVRPLVRLLDRLGMGPLGVTLSGLALTLLGSWVVARGDMVVGTMVFLVGSGFDMLDGDLARLQGRVSRRGAFLDSCLDRFGEAAMLTGLAVWWMRQQEGPWQLAVVLILLTMFGSLATSYVRARAEGAGETCTVGLLQRTERVILLALGALVGGRTLLVVLAVLAVLTVATTVQRIVHVAKKLPGPEVRS
jgi:CDP-diacylglycerol--glycerol-3-phosphate 3-phosphatidyltransferase